VAQEVLHGRTKPLASVAAMTLVEDGRIQLTDPVAKYLPEFKERPSPRGWW
jgi:CubicO group peptidase (beta-lactamase class C family)